MSFMAEEKKEIIENVGRSFEGIKFKKVEDTFAINVQYNGQLELLTLELVNERSKNVFKQFFDKKSIHKITDQCKLAPELVVQVIIDTLSSKELIYKHIRLYIYKYPTR